MSKSITVDRVKVVAEMARQNLTTEELSLKAGVGRNAIWKMRKGQPVWRTTAGHVAAALGVTVDDQPFHRLRVRFAEMELRQGDVAQAAGMAKSTMTARMKGYQPWTSDEITRVAAVLNIPREQIGEFFFEPSPKSKKGA